MQNAHDDNFLTNSDEFRFPFGISKKLYRTVLAFQDFPNTYTYLRSVQFMYLVVPEFTFPYANFAMTKTYANFRLSKSIGTYGENPESIISFYLSYR